MLCSLLDFSWKSSSKVGLFRVDPAPHWPAILVKVTNSGFSERPWLTTYIVIETPDVQGTPGRHMCTDKWVYLSIHTHTCTCAHKHTYTCAHMHAYWLTHACTRAHALTWLKNHVISLFKFHFVDSCYVVSLLMAVMSQRRVTTPFFGSRECTQSS